MAKPSQATAPVEQSTAVVPTQSNGAPMSEKAMELFGRAINDPTKITRVVFKQTLTKPLLAVNRRKEILVGVISEPYTITLPMAGRSEKDAEATVVDVYDFEEKMESTLICTAVMLSAFKRDQNPLTGRVFAIRAGDIKADKKYRVVDVQEVEIRQEDKP